ncbi:helix-turn-helix domain-containing protein [Acidaminococcus sp.]|uniref:helix-turn-helix domain-containing protein n=1 Tax=Acidaminococcus sp. TaxID=1872103 RepID=UPI003D7ED304
MTSDELAQLLGVTRTAVNVQLRKGRIKGHKDSNRHWVIDEPDPVAAYKALRIESKHRIPVRVGDRYGYWTVLEPPDYKTRKVRCQCDCGRVRNVFLVQLYRGLSTSCGCHHVDNPTDKQKAVRAFGREVLDAVHKHRLTIKYIGKKVNKNSTTGHTGVSFNKRAKKYFAYIMVNRQKIHLGYYERIEDAIAARKAAEEKYYVDRQEKVDEIIREVKKSTLNI